MDFQTYATEIRTIVHRREDDNFIPDSPHYLKKTYSFHSHRGDGLTLSGMSMLFCFPAIPSERLELEASRPSWSI